MDRSETKTLSRERWLKPIILATQEAEIRRIVVRGHPRQKVSKTHLNQWLGMVVHACHPRYIESINRRLGSRLLWA
jgi:hypothetical protein